MNIAIINEICTAGATRCARDLEKAFDTHHTVRYYPRQGKETVHSLLDDLRTFKPDVVHCHSYYGDLPYRMLATLSHYYPTCFTPHDPRPIGTIDTVCWDCSHHSWCFRCPLVTRYRKLFLYNPYFWQRLYKRLMHWNTSKTLQVVAPSRWLHQRLLTTELRQFKIHHIPYGIDLDHFHPIPGARQRLGFPENIPSMLYIAHPNQLTWKSNPRKGLHVLADAFVNVVIPKHPNALLCVAGEKLVPNHPNVKPLGFIPQADIPLYYSAVDLFAVPTLADNLPYTILEAMGCATMVTASDVGGISEEIEHAVTGYVVPSNDYEALGQALVWALDHPENTKDMGRAGRIRVEKLFNMDTFVQRHETLYQTMLEH